MRNALCLAVVLCVTSCAIFRDDLPEEPGVDAGTSDVANVPADVGRSDVTTATDTGETATDTQRDADTQPDADARPTYEEVIMASDPVGYWRLDDEVTPFAVDSSGNGYDGVYQGVPTLGQEGAFPGSNTAVLFDGESIEVADFPLFEGTSPFTIEAWIQPTDAAIAGAIVGHSERPEGDTPTLGWRLSVDEGESVGGPRLRASRGEENAWGEGNSVAEGTWYHVAMIYDGVNIIIYQDRAVVGDRSSDVAIEGVLSPLTIATATRWGSFRGVIDEVAVYDRALPLTELIEHYDAAVGAP